MKNIIQIVFCIVAGCYFLGVQYYVGCKVDLISWNDEIRRYQIIALTGLIICIITLFFIRKKKAQVTKIIKNILLGLILIALCCSAAFTPKWSKYEKEAAEATEHTGILYEYAWEDVLAKSRMGNKHYLLYVGRSDCPECREFEPMLEKIAKENDVFVAYYDTLSDRKKADFDQKMNMLKVKSVPAVVVIGNNEIIEAESKIYTSEKALEVWIEKFKSKYRLPAL